MWGSEGCNDEDLRKQELHNWSLRLEKRLATTNDEKHEEYRSGDKEGKRADKDDERQVKQRGTLDENTCGGQQDQSISKT